MLFILGILCIVLSTLFEQYFFLILFLLVIVLGSGAQHRVLSAVVLGVVVGIVTDLFWILPLGTVSLLYGAFVVVYELYGLRFNVRSPLFLFVYCVFYSVGFVSLLSIRITYPILLIFAFTYGITNIYLHNREVSEVGIVEDI